MVQRATSPAPGQPSKRLVYNWAPPSEDIFTTRAPALKQVPRPSRTEVSNELAAVIWDCVLVEQPEQSLKAHANLLMFTRCILGALPPKHQ